MISADSHAMFRRLCGEAKRIVLTTHMNPDGDAIGSEIGLARFLMADDRELHPINGDATPEILAFVDGPPTQIEVYDASTHDALIEGADLVILVDNSAPDRLGRMEEIMARVAGNTLCIDHHPTRDAPWAHNILEVEACATSAMIHELTQGCGWTPDARAAEALYLGLATDTGFFRFNSTNAQAHSAAAELLRLGVDPAAIYRRVYERNSEAYTRLLGHTLTGLQLHAGGAVAAAEVPRALIHSLHAEAEDTSEITTALLAIDGVRVAILFRELADGRVKVSLRSKGDLDVHGLATEFGGGGHRNASGIVMRAGIAEAVQRVTDRAAALAASSPL